jgi:hypothetical protein
MTADKEFNAAVRRICATTFPQGWDWSPTAPNTFEELAATYYKTGRMVVTDAWVAEDHPAFEDAYTYRAFRAWHDWMHLMGDFQFTLEGECGAANAQHAQLASLYGNAKADRWMRTLNYELVIYNFGECASCEA